MPWILRDTPQPLWSQVQQKAAREGWPLKALILGLLQDYVDGKIRPSGTPPMAPDEPSRPLPYIENQRDELLSLLKDAIATLSERDLKNTAPRWLARAKAAIAKADAG